MAINEKKAESMLNPLATMMEEEKKKPRERRPLLASECRDSAAADRWRQQILREIGRKVAEIQNEGLDEHRLVDLNDEINKLILEKSHWERRILELGGPNYTEQSANMTNLGAPNPNATGSDYRYFGAAKKLLERPAEEAIRAAVVADLEFMEGITREARKAVKSGEVLAVGTN